MDEERSGGELGAELRQAKFPQALLGYDRKAVDAFLGRVADLIDGGVELAGKAAPDVADELRKVGERTAGILTAAEEAGAKVRSEAGEYAESLRTTVDEETRKTRLNASQKADELIADAEAKAEKIIDEAIQRRRRLNQAVTSLTERREEITGEARRLADQLLAAADSIRDDEAAVPEDAEGTDPEAPPEPDVAEVEVEAEAVDAQEPEAGAEDPSGEPTEVLDGENPESAAEQETKVQESR